MAQIAGNLSSTMKFPTRGVVLFSASIEVIFAVLAILGNLLFILTFLMKKKLRTSAFVYLVNLSVTDILAAALVSVPSVDAFLNGGWRFGHTLCILHNLLHPLLLSTSLWLSAFIAANRYIYVVHKNKYRLLTNKATVTLSVAFVWCFPFAIRSPAYFIPGSVRYLPPTFLCRGFNMNQLITSALIYIPCVAVIVCYSLTFRWVRKCRMRVLAHQAHLTTTAQSNNVGPSNHEVRMLYALSCIFLLILLGYLPFVLLVNISASLGEFPDPDANMLLYPLMHLGGVLNPVLYGICNRNYRRAYAEIASLARCHCCRDQPKPRTVFVTSNSAAASHPTGELSLVSSRAHQNGVVSEVAGRN